MYKRHDLLGINVKNALFNKTVYNFILKKMNKTSTVYSPLYETNKTYKL